MIKFINKLTGTVMWVADERKEEYETAGHKLAVSLSKNTAEKKTGSKTRRKKVS